MRKEKSDSKSDGNNKMQVIVEKDANLTIVQQRKLRRCECSLDQVGAIFSDIDPCFPRHICS